MKEYTLTLQGLTVPRLNGEPVRDLLKIFEDSVIFEGDEARERLYSDIYMRMVDFFRLEGDPKKAKQVFRFIIHNFASAADNCFSMQGGLQKGRPVDFYRCVSSTDIRYNIFPLGRIEFLTEDKGQRLGYISALKYPRSFNPMNGDYSKARLKVSSPFRFVYKE